MLTGNPTRRGFERSRCFQQLTGRHRKVFLESFHQAKHGQCSDHQSTAVIRSPLTSGWTYHEDPYTQRVDRSQQAEMPWGTLPLPPHRRKG